MIHLLYRPERRRMSKLYSVVGCVLFALLIVSCNSGAERAASAKATEAAAVEKIAAAKATEAAAIKVIAAASATKVATPTNTRMPTQTPTQRVTLTPTPRPTPTPTATPTPTPRGIVAVVTMRQGTVYEVDHVSGGESRGKTSGFYQIYDDYTRDYLPLLTGPVGLQIPQKRIASVTVVDAIRGPAAGKPVEATLVDGTKLQGYLVQVSYYKFHQVQRIIGRLTVSGVSASLSLSIEEVKSLTFTQDGEISATVVAADGTVTEKVTKIQFEIDGGTSLSSVSDQAFFPMKVGNVVLEIPVADIQTIQRDKDRFIVTMRDGKKLEGTIEPTQLFLGATTLVGESGQFRCEFAEIQAVTFK